MLQLGTLDRLASLSLWLHHHEGTIALSCPLRSLTSLQWVSKGLGLGCLAQQTGLRWLEMVAVVPEAGPDASSLAAALAPLCQLTSLKLVDLRCSTDGLPQALQQLRALRRLRLDNMPPATLLPGPWLAGLRRLTVDVLTLLGSLPALHAAVGLQRLHVLHFSAGITSDAQELVTLLLRWRTRSGRPCANGWSATPSCPAWIWCLKTALHRCHPSCSVACWPCSGGAQGWRCTAVRAPMHAFSL